MYDRGLSVLEQYGLEAGAVYRGRGALICETQEGLVADSRILWNTQEAGVPGKASGENFRYLSHMDGPDPEQ